MRRFAIQVAAVVVGLAHTACTTGKKVVDPRDGCEVCHKPRPAEGGDPVGLEDAHAFGDVKLSCTDCHGGDGRSYVQREAHPDSRGAPAFLRNLTSGQLDRVDPGYLQFINPGDLRVANRGCGAASPASGGTGCHQEIVDRVRSSMMAHTAGEVVVARFRAGSQDDTLARVGATRLYDSNFDPSIPNTIEAMAKFNPPPPRLSLLPMVASASAATSTLAHELYAEVQDDYMAKSCFRCHLWDFGENRFHADFRSSGCSACHMIYSDDGTSQSMDPTIPKDVSPHPLTHAMTAKVPTEQCTHCHYRGGRIGPSFQGYREGGGAGFNPPNPESLGVAQHGHDAAFYIKDEDTTNTFDETPPDVHFEKGLDCIDCHFEREMHGDGHLYSDTQVFVGIECEDCHGTIDSRSTLKLGDGTAMTNLARDEAGDVWLTTKVDGTRHRITQVVESVDRQSPRYSAAADRAMGRDARGFSHSDGLECYTCHAGWSPSCYGCHVTVDYSRSSRLLTTGESRVGQPSGARQWVEIDDLVLMYNTDGKIAPSMPAERFTLTVKDAQGETLFERRVRRRTATSTTPGFGQRTFQPHTTRKTSAWSVCSRCHIRADGANRAMVEVTVGLGSDRYLLEDDEGRVHRMDAIVDANGNSLVEVGHPDPEESRPLGRTLREKLLTEPVE